MRCERAFQAALPDELDLVRLEANRTPTVSSRRTNGNLLKLLKTKTQKMARPEGFEPTTLCSGGTRSIHLSYGRAEYRVEPGRRR